MASNTKIGLTNYIASATLMNGSGGGAPALIQTSPYTMSNLVGSDRYKFWMSSALAASSAFNVDFDLGANRSINAAAMLGARLFTGASLPAMDVYYQTGAYAPAGAWTFLNGTAPFARDTGIALGTVTARSVRFTLSTSAGAATQFTLGKFWVGSLTDLGAIHDIGGGMSPYRNRLETPTPTGATVLCDLGDPGADFLLPWSNLDSTARTTLLTMQAATGSFVLVDSEAVYYEVYVRGGLVETARNLGSLFDANIELARLP